MRTIEQLSTHGPSCYAAVSEDGAGSCGLLELGEQLPSAPGEPAALGLGLLLSHMGSLPGLSLQGFGGAHTEREKAAAQDAPTWACWAPGPSEPAPWAESVLLARVPGGMPRDGASAFSRTSCESAASGGTWAQPGASVAREHGGPD